LICCRVPLRFLLGAGPVGPRQSRDCACCWARAWRDARDSQSRTLRTCVRCLFRVSCCRPRAGRQTTSFIDYSTEAGILLGGNGAPRAMPVSLRTLARSSTRCYSYPVPYPPTHLTTHPFGHSLHSLTRLPSLSALALKSLFSNEVDDVALCPPSGPLPSARF
jgi:hypothetical protein